MTYVWLALFVVAMLATSVQAIERLSHRVARAPAWADMAAKVLLMCVSTLLGWYGEWQALTAVLAAWLIARLSICLAVAARIERDAKQAAWDAARGYLGCGAKKL